MSYLMGEMLVYLLAVALLGIIVGWLFTRASYKRKVEDAEVVLLSQLHDVTTRLDATELLLDNTSDLLEKERSRETANVVEFERLKSELFDSKSQFTDLTKSFDESSKQLKLLKMNLETKQEENQKMAGDFDAVKNRLSVFQSDLDEIVDQSGILRSAFERARLDLATKDKRLAELESMTTEGFQMAALSGNTEPELAISRIARLQTRVQELFDEVNQKDKELDRLKSVNDSDQRSGGPNMQADDLQQIGGIGGVLEEKLNRLGVSRFHDIASWDDSDIDRFDQELDFHGRIKRENWVKQAKKLSQSSWTSKFRGH